MKVLAIATQKGGVGKTTTSLEIAAAMSQEGKKILLIDNDQQGNLTKYVGAEDESALSIYDTLHNPEKVQDAIIHLNLFDFIKSSPELSRADIEFSNSEDVFLLDDVLDKIKEEYDYIVIDNGPLRNRLLQMVYVATDYIIAPCDDTEGGTDGLINVYNDIEKMKNTRVPLSNAVIIGTVVTRFKGQTTVNKAVIDILTSIMKEINERGFVTCVRESIKASEAKYAKKSVQEYSPYNNVAVDYRKVVKEILKYEREDN